MEGSEGCFFTQAVTVQRGCEEATGQLACHVSAASDLPSLQFGSGGRVTLEGHGVLQCCLLTQQESRTQVILGPSLRKGNWKGGFKGTIGNATKASCGSSYQTE